MCNIVMTSLDVQLADLHEKIAENCRAVTSSKLSCLPTSAWPPRVQPVGTLGAGRLSTVVTLNRIAQQGKQIHQPHVQYKFRHLGHDHHRQADLENALDTSRAHMPRDPLC